MVFEGVDGMGKSVVKWYVVAKFRCKVTERPFGKLCRNWLLLQKILIR